MFVGQTVTDDQDSYKVCVHGRGAEVMIGRTGGSGLNRHTRVYGLFPVVPRLDITNTSVNITCFPN